MGMDKITSCYARGLKAGHFGEVKLTNFHGRHDHVKRLFSAGTKRQAHGLNIAEHVNQALVEAEVAYVLSNSPVFHQESAVASHAGDDFFVGIDLADVPETRHQDAAIGGSDHLGES